MLWRVGLLRLPQRQHCPAAAASTLRKFWVWQNHSEVPVLLEAACCGTAENFVRANTHSKLKLGCSEGASHAARLRNVYWIHRVDNWREKPSQKTHLSAKSTRRHASTESVTVQSRVQTCWPAKVFDPQQMAWQFAWKRSSQTHAKVQRKRPRDHDKRQSQQNDRSIHRGFAKPRTS